MPRHALVIVLLAACRSSGEPTLEGGTVLQHETPRCRGNLDAAHADPAYYCAEGTHCDLDSGRCISAESCTASTHCDLNHYCDEEERTCVLGCRDLGDCQLGWVCKDGTCVAGNSGSNCTVCPEGETSYCDYGERCSGSGSCSAHAQAGSLCNSCGADAACAAGMVCLRDSEVANPNATNAQYCTVTCNADADCPNGYGTCGGLIVYTEECTGPGTCSNPNAACLGDAEASNAFCSCTSNSDCNIYEGSGLCDGFWGCLTDFSDCSDDSDCACYEGLCLGSDLPCSTSADCRSSCVMMDGGDGTSVGVCETNIKVCGKDTGLTCTEARSGQADCRDY